MSSEGKQIVVRNYTPGENDRVTRAFFNSRSFVRVIMGPVGSGKTCACLMNFLKLAMLQEPSPIDGVRKTNWAVFRDTYRNLERTSLKTWLEWVPKELGEYRGGGNGEPAIHKLDFPMADGTRVSTEIQFIAVGEHNIEDVAKGFEPTGVFINEMDLLPEAHFDFLTGRCGRYPRDVDGGPTWSGLWGDFNAPDFDNWCYTKFFKNPLPAEIEVFRQPGGMEPDAENIDRLPGGRDYYRRQIAVQPEWKTRRMVHNKFGFSRDGLPVYKDEFDDRRHVSEEQLHPIPGRRIVVGMDAGLRPAAAFMQQDARGQIRVLDEISTEYCFSGEFGELINNLIRDREYDRFDLRFVIDPSALYAAQGSKSDTDVFAMQVSKIIGHKIHPAKTQKAAARRGALKQPMRLSLNAETPGFILSGPTCPTLRSGLNSRFRYKEIGRSGSGNYGDTPEKTIESHICEAAEYGALELVGIHFVAHPGQNNVGPIPVPSPPLILPDGREAPAFLNQQKEVTGHFNPKGF